jgi:hypothetical protein
MATFLVRATHRRIGGTLVNTEDRLRGVPKNGGGEIAGWVGGEPIQEQKRRPSWLVAVVAAAADRRGLKQHPGQLTFLGPSPVRRISAHRVIRPLFEFRRDRLVGLFSKAASIGRHLIDSAAGSFRDEAGYQSPRSTRLAASLFPHCSMSSATNQH